MSNDPLSRAHEPWDSETSPSSFPITSCWHLTSDSPLRCAAAWCDACRVCRYAKRSFDDTHSEFFLFLPQEPGQTPGREMVNKIENRKRKQESETFPCAIFVYLCAPDPRNRWSVCGGGYVVHTTRQDRTSDWLIDWQAGLGWLVWIRVRAQLSRTGQ